MRAGASLAIIGTSAAGRGTTLNARDFGARGDGVADDYPAIQRFLNALAARGGRGLIPEGTYLCSDHPAFIDVSPPETIRITCNGRIKMSAKGTWGSAFLVRNSHNIMWEGGILDGGGSGSDGSPLGNNGWAMSGMPHTGKRSTHDIYISGMTLTNCRASTQFLGGKGFSLQRGVEKCYFNLEIDECDFGASLEASAVDQRSYIRQIDLRLKARNCRLGGLLLMQGYQDTYSANDAVMSAKIIAELHDCGTWEVDGQSKIITSRGQFFALSHPHFVRGDTVRLVNSKGRALGSYPLTAIPRRGGLVGLTQDAGGQKPINAEKFKDAALVVPDGWAAILLDRAQNLSIDAHVSTTRSAAMTVMRGRMSNSSAYVKCSYPEIAALWDTMRHGVKEGRIPSRPGSVRSVNNHVEFDITGRVIGPGVKAYDKKSAYLTGSQITVRGGTIIGGNVLPDNYGHGNSGLTIPVS